MNYNELWDNFLIKIKDLVSPFSYETWFTDTRLLKFNNNTAVVIVPTNLHKKHLADNYKNEMEGVLSSITGNSYNFEFILESENLKKENEFMDNSFMIKEDDFRQSSADANLNPKYTCIDNLSKDLLHILFLQAYFQIN